MLLKEKIQQLQNLTKRKITHEQVAKVLGLGSKQAVQNRITRQQELKEWEINALDEAFLTEINKIKQENCITVEHINIKPSCGHGTAVYDDAEVTPVRIGSEIIQNLWKTKPENLKLFTASGDSMSPIIEDGDLLLIDTSKIDFTGGGIFLLTINNDWFIKRLRKRLSGELDVISDNDKYPIETFLPDTEIEIIIKGRVIKNLTRGL